MSNPSGARRPGGPALPRYRSVLGVTGVEQQNGPRSEDGEPLRFFRAQEAQQVRKIRRSSLLVNSEFTKVRRRALIAIREHVVLVVVP